MNYHDETPWLTNRFLRKDISFPSPEERTNRYLIGLGNYFKSKNDMVGFWWHVALVAHCDHGSQMWVSKEVSADLLMSDIHDPDLATVRWPNDSLEFVFEDPAIPGFVLRRNMDHSLARWLAPRVSEGADVRHNSVEDTIIFVASEGRKVAQGVTLCAVTGSIEMVNKYAEGEDCEIPKEGDEFLNQSEERVMRKLILLAYKVLLFSSMDSFTPRITRDAPTRKQGGKAGFQNRPKTDRVIVEYLPRQIAEKTRLTQEAQSTREFRGRRGHMRCFRSPKFVKMQGKEKWIYPIPARDGSVPRRAFRVVKPKNI